MFDSCPEDIRILSLGVNCTGSHVSILCQQVCQVYFSHTLSHPHVYNMQESSTTSQVLLLWEVETDSVKVLTPSALSLSVYPSSSTSSSNTTASNPIPSLSHVSLPPELTETVVQEQERLCRCFGKRTVCDHYWDTGDSRLLVVAASSQLQPNQKRSHEEVCTHIMCVFR